jgi:hypothetical protein
MPSHQRPPRPNLPDTGDEKAPSHDRSQDCNMNDLTSNRIPRKGKLTVVGDAEHLPIYPDVVCAVLILVFVVTVVISHAVTAMLLLAAPAYECAPGGDRTRPRTAELERARKQG